MEDLGQVPVVRVEIPSVANPMKVGQNVVLPQPMGRRMDCYRVFSVKLFDELVRSF